LRLGKVKESIQGELTRSYRLALDHQEKAKQYENLYKGMSKLAIDHDLENVKRNVNLVLHLASMGYSRNKDKSCQTYAVMEKEGDKLIVRTSPNRTGHWVYMSAVDNNDKGTIVDLMLRRGYEYKDIRGLSSKHLDTTVWEQAYKGEEKQTITDKKMQSRLAQHQLANVQLSTKHINYLERRGIEPSTYSIYKGKGLEVGQQAVFGLYQELDHHSNGRLCSTISYYFTESGESQKRFQSALPRGLSVLKGNEESNKIIIMESPIDALSHKQMYGGNAIYICTCGNITAKIKEELTSVIKGARLHNKELFLSFDNDEAGKRMHKQVMEISKDFNVTPQSIQPSKGKDWNEELKETKKYLGVGRGIRI
jgi:5S rRNA maturation endonuclease (ribonuclease M5)